MSPKPCSRGRERVVLKDCERLPRPRCAQLGKTGADEVLGSVRTMGSVCYFLPMEVTGAIKDGKVVLPASVKLPDGAKVRVVFGVAQGGLATPLEREALAWDDIEADLRSAKRIRFGK